MKKRKSYFIVLPKNRGILFASWKIDSLEISWKTDPVIDHDIDLIIEVYSIDNCGRSLIDSIPVHGLENNWHIFTKKEYFGKRIILSLRCPEINGESIEILKSKEIDIPAIEPGVSEDQDGDKTELYRLSKISLNDSSGTGNSSSW